MSKNLTANKLASATQSYSYDEVLIIPSFSDIASRNECEVDSGRFFVAPMMDLISPQSLANAAANRFPVVIDRYRPMTQRIELYLNSGGPNSPHWISISAAEASSPEIIAALLSASSPPVCIDTANGDNQTVYTAVCSLRASLGLNTPIMAGNVATPQAAMRLFEAGASHIRLGVGSGGMCTTRLMTGCGFPMASLIANTSAFLDSVCGPISPVNKPSANSPSGHKNRPFIIADGGIKHPGDAAKALALGADAIMIGSFLAGSIDTPSGSPELGFPFRGMASASAQLEWRGKIGNNLPEGASTHNSTPKRFDNSTSTTRLLELVSGVKSAMSYTGSRTIPQFQSSAQFTLVSSSGHAEGTPHYLK